MVYLVVSIPTCPYFGNPSLNPAVIKITFGNILLGTKRRNELTQLIKKQEKK